MGIDRHLLDQLALPVREQISSFNVRVPLKVLTFMFTLVEIINGASFYLKRNATNNKPAHEIEEVRLARRRFAEKLKDINYNFVATYQKILNLVKIIVKIRTQEILQKIKAEEYLWKEKGTDLNRHYFLLKQIYIKLFRVRNFTYYNQTRLAHIASLHQLLVTKSSKNLRLPPIDSSALEESLLENRIDKIRRNLEYQWVKQKGKGNKSLTQLRRLGELVDRTQISNKLKLGIWTGVIIFMISTVTFLIINYDINFTSEPQFEKTFPIWRGVCYFILLIWLFAIQSYIFQRFGLSFRLLTIMNNFYIPKYPVLFVCAAFFTFLHLFMFMLYIFALAEFGITFPDNFELHYLPAVSWVALFMFFVIPLPFFHFDKRMYPAFMLVRSIFSPIFGIEFKYHWWTEIWISFRQPFRDLMFTFSYYFIDSSIVYEKTIIFETLAGILIYSLRIIQNIRQMYQTKVWGGMPFYGSIKCSLNIITMITSYFFRVEEDQIPMFYLSLWICSALISSSYAYYFDLKWDWGLLQNNNYLRKQLMYGPKKLYYFIIVINLLFRFVWVLNISPDILRSIPLQRYFLIMVVSCIEILRRNVWSIFRIQKQHIMAEKYYDSIGVTRNKEEEKKDVPYDQLLVEMGDLNKTFSVENQQVMKQIYEECEEELMSPTRLKNKLSKNKGYQEVDRLQQMHVRKSDLLDALSQEMQILQQSYDRMLLIIKNFFEEVDNSGGTIIDFETDRYQLYEIE